tara:strand:- start:2431 stop:2532 length:102 start_codon:yes stop_codon:yes gene_type:complete
MEIFTYPQMQQFYGIARFFDQVLNQKGSINQQF